MLLGNGNGTFKPSKKARAGINPYSVVPGDFDKDGKLDLAVANFRTLNSTVTVLRRSIQHLNHSGAIVLPGYADSQVVAAVPVEVTVDG